MSGFGGSIWVRQDNRIKNSHEKAQNGQKGIRDEARGISKKGFNANVAKGAKGTKKLDEISRRCTYGGQVSGEKLN